ncbi:hypothetical protein RFI_02379 [Reticulomyxa filosa]|uniref:Uncharacterized protein n=1 Tax=Reticulomyxa filosa TaxID=46433 RepID=X6P9G5_RETFI|nr:hypothetical protein RFI_02379 [Reticulomyxa filosa]|eukprot:ETO34709.1 hypothetical protein RFI_02379 [Reticulomyxa filosa]
MFTNFKFFTSQNKKFVIPKPFNNLFYKYSPIYDKSKQFLHKIFCRFDAFSASQIIYCIILFALIYTYFIFQTKRRLNSLSIRNRKGLELSDIAHHFQDHNKKKKKYLKNVGINTKQFININLQRDFKKLNNKKTVSKNKKNLPNVRTSFLKCCQINFLKS